MKYLNEKKSAAYSLLLLFIPLGVCTIDAKVVDFGLKLPDFIDEHPSKSWLIKFYAPWCYHCQQLELTYINVAEKIYHKHDNLIVGRVDCTKNGPVCEKYGVHSYPTIIFLNQNTRITYKGDRSLESLIDFAERLDGPDIKTIDECNHLKTVTNRHGLIVLSTEKNFSSKAHNEFKWLASSLKSSYWFYYLSKTCKDYVIEDGLYLLKRHLNRAIKFKQNSTSNDPKKDIANWIVKESFPVYGPISSINFDRAMSIGKLLVISILDEYKPAKKFSQSSRYFHKLFGRFAKNNIQHDEQLLFAWSSDLDLIQSIVIGQVLVPNVMVLKPDFSYHLMITDQKDLNEKVNEIPENLQERSIKMLIAAIKLDELSYQGGNSYIYRILRHIYNQYNIFTSMYQANPLLATVLIGLPGVIVLFVIYTTCCYDDANFEQVNDDDGHGSPDEEEEEQQQLLNHAKQD